MNSIISKAMKNNIRINVIVNIIRTLVLTLLSFITFPWVCRYLGEAGVGAYTWANTFVAYFLILAKVGVPNLAVRECVKVRDNKEQLSNKAQMFFIIQLVATLVSFGLMSSLVFTVPGLKEESSLIFLLSLNFLTGVFSFEWIFIALEKQFYMSVRSIIVLALAAILVVGFVTTPSDIYIYAIITISVTLLSTIANLFYVRKFISFKKTLPYNFKQFLKPLSILCVLAFSISLYNQTDTLILGFIDPTKTEVASYSVGIKGVDIVIGVMSALSTVFIPRAAFYYGKEDKRFFNNLNKYSANICLFIVLPAIVTMAVLAYPICSLISGNYDYTTADATYVSGPLVLIVLAFMMLTYSLSEMIYGQVLLPMKKEKYYLFAILGGSLLNIIFSIILGGVLPNYIEWLNPAVGVAFGTVLTDIAILIFLLGITWKWTKKAIFNKNTIKIVVGSVVILAISLLIYKPLNMLWAHMSLGGATSAILTLVCVVFIDAIVYLVLLGIMKEDLVYSFIRKKKEVEG